MKNLSKPKKIFLIIFCLNLLMIGIDLLMFGIIPGGNDGLGFLFLFIFMGNIAFLAITSPIIIIYLLYYFVKRKNYIASAVVIAGTVVILTTLYFMFFYGYVWPSGITENDIEVFGDKIISTYKEDFHYSDTSSSFDLSGLFSSIIDSETINAIKPVPHYAKSYRGENNLTVDLKVYEYESLDADKAIEMAKDEIDRLTWDGLRQKQKFEAMIESGNIDGIKYFISPLTWYSKNYYRGKIWLIYDLTVITINYSVYPSRQSFIRTKPNDFKLLDFLG
ncbi:MAG: hypothetical protein FWF08_10000 [Oscillospiraceae bacterium]|nr:hypothetical protein [Oscillospiraceae bacterium]